MKTAGWAVLGLSALAIAHPLLSTLGRGATFFVAHNAGALELVLFTLAAYMGPPAIILAIAACCHIFNSRLANGFVCSATGLLAGVWVMGMASGGPALVALPLALLAAALTAWCYATRAELREFLRIVGICSPLVVIYFLAFTPARTLLLPDSNSNGTALAGRQTPVVMLLLDELPLAAITTPDGELDAGRLPNFARLERMSTWYHDTTTVSVQTEKAVPAILSGMRPNENSQPIYSEFPCNLFTLLAPSHRVSALETFTRLCPETICAGARDAGGERHSAAAMYRDASIAWLHAILPGELAGRYLPGIHNKWRDFAGTDSPGSVVALMFDMQKNQKLQIGTFISQIRDSTGPTLNYLHLALPHVPWIYLPDGTVYNGQFIPGETTQFYGWIDDQYLVDEGILRYSLQLEYVDLLLGEVLDALEQSGRLSETLLVVVADHGAAFTPDQKRRTPAPSTLASVSRVPLFIKYPGQIAGVRDDRKIETIDILPTIADALGLPLDASLDGQSILSARWQPAARQVLEGAGTISNFEAEMDLAANSAKFYRVLESGRSALAALGLGAGRPYIGRAAPPPAIADGTRFLKVHDSRWYTEVDLDSEFLPARLWGTVAGVTTDTDILIALNDTFAGSGRVYNESGHVSLMLDPRRFQTGHNHLRAFVLDGRDLHEIAVDSDFAHWRVLRSGEGVVTVTDEREKSYRQDAQLTGHFEINILPDRPGTLYGYACDERQHLTPAALLLLDNETVITDGFHSTSRPLLFKEEAVPSELKCWFWLELGENLVDRGRSLSVVALFEDGRAIEIRPTL